MYLYYDKNGILREIINDYPLRQYDEQNYVYMYFEDTKLPSESGDARTITGLDVCVLKNGASEVVRHEVNLSDTDSYVQDFEFPFEPNRLLNYFQYGVKYRLFVYELSSSDLNTNGSIVITPVLYFTQGNKSQGEFIGVVASSNIIPTEMIDNGEYLRLLEIVNRINNKIGYVDLGSVDYTQTYEVETGQCVELSKGNAIIVANNIYFYKTKENIAEHLVEFVPTINELNTSSTLVSYRKAIWYTSNNTLTFPLTTTNIYTRYAVDEVTNGLSDIVNEMTIESYENNFGALDDYAVAPVSHADIPFGFHTELVENKNGLRISFTLNDNLDAPQTFKITIRFVDMKVIDGATHYIYSGIVGDATHNIASPLLITFINNNNSWVIDYVGLKAIKEGLN